MHVCMYVCKLYFIILKGIGDMTAKEAAVRVMIEDYFPDVPDPGDQVTGCLCLNAYLMKKLYNKSCKNFNLRAK